MNTKMLFVAGVFSTCFFTVPAMAQTQDDNIGAAMERDAQAMRDSMERDAQAMRDSMERDSQAMRDSNAGDKPFDKDGNPNYDAQGNYQGCHGLGCDVDNPDSAVGERSGSDSSSSNSSSRSPSSSSSTSFDFGGRRGRGNGSWSVDSVLGKWTLGDKNGSSTCTLTLSSNESFGLRQAWTNVGCPDGFFSVNRWRAAGRDLQLTDMGGNVIGNFRQVGPGRFEGRRDKDGAPMFLSR